MKSAPNVLCSSRCVKEDIGDWADSADNGLASFYISFSQGSDLLRDISLRYYIAFPTLNVNV